MKTPPFHTQCGFTLIEVLIAITLLAVGILAAASMQITSIGGNDLAIRVTEATTWGEDKIEELMGKPYDDSDLQDDNGDGVAGLDFTDAAGQPADGSEVHQFYVGAVATAGYTVFWNVADDYPVADCKTIRVIVRRSDKGTMKLVPIDFIRMKEI